MDAEDAAHEPEDAHFARDREGAEDARRSLWQPLTEPSQPTLGRYYVTRLEDLDAGGAFEFLSIPRPPWEKAEILLDPSLSTMGGVGSFGLGGSTSMALDRRQLGAALLACRPDRTFDASSTYTRDFPSRPKHGLDAS
jgi:hypothetical protein